MNCPLCESDQIFTVYSGPIRKGKWPNKTEPTEVHQCGECSLAFLNERMRTEIDYSDGSYRELLGEPTNGREHALSQNPRRLAQLFVAADIRNEKVIDIGAGDCAYADMVSEFTQLYVTVEPAEHFDDQLGKYGWFKTIDEAIEVFGPEFDRVVIWDVIEHVEDPVQFIADCKKLLVPGGKISGCTPNLITGYWLTDCKPYLEYFYRLQHPWYFSHSSIETLSKRCAMSLSKCWTEQRMTCEELEVIISKNKLLLLDKIYEMNPPVSRLHDTLFFELVNNGKLH